MESTPGVTSLFITVVGAGGYGGTGASATIPNGSGGGGGGASAPASEIYTITSGDKANGIPFQIGISNSTNSKAPTTSTYFKSITEIASAGGTNGGPGSLSIGIGGSLGGIDGNTDGEGGNGGSCELTIGGKYIYTSAGQGGASLNNGGSAIGYGSGGGGTGSKSGGSGGGGLIIIMYSMSSTS